MKHLCAAIIKRWVADATMRVSPRHPDKREALEDFIDASKDPDNFFILSWASQELDVTPELILFSLLQRVGNQTLIRKCVAVAKAHGVKLAA